MVKKKHLSQRKYAEFVGVSLSTIQQAIKKGKINYSKESGINPNLKKNKIYASSIDRAHQKTKLIESGIIERSPDSDIDHFGVKYATKRLRKLELESVKLEIQNAKMRGDLIERDIVYNEVLLFVDKQFNAIDRSLNTVLEEIVPKILSRGELTNKDREAALNEIAKARESSRKQIIKKIEEAIKKSQGA